MVVGVDFSDSSLRAFEQSLRIAAWNGASLHVFHAITTQRAAYMPTDPGVRPTNLEGRRGRTISPRERWWSDIL